MKKSRYFSDSIKSYIDEVDDLLTDSEGKSMLQKRLNIKRREIDAILPMIEFSPEMVAVAFYDAFRFKSPEIMQQIVLSEPGYSSFLSWAELKDQLTIADWAGPLIESSLKAQGGDAFLVATAALEFLRNKDTHTAPEPEPEARKERADEGDEDDGEEMDDLGEAGADWLAEQGFDSLEH
ncbi:MAG: hypothetical protein B7Y41_12670 [Hydrogenophilales bacterium 28-61-23]|nr:MAG: hypothetical protein B7Y41_12670 [Hydrogenophilales bacterium 28-61-23]